VTRTRSDLPKLAGHLAIDSLILVDSSPSTHTPPFKHPGVSSDQPAARDGRRDLLGEHWVRKVLYLTKGNGLAFVYAARSASRSRGRIIVSIVCSVVSMASSLTQGGSGSYCLVYCNTSQWLRSEPSSVMM
jgi:hypothetical protein